MFWMCITENRLGEAIPIHTHNILFYGEISNFCIIFIPTPDFPHFYYMLGGNLVSLLYGDVSVIVSSLPQISKGPDLKQPEKIVDTVFLL